MKLKINTQNLKVDNWFTAYEIEDRLMSKNFKNKLNNQLIIFLRYEIENI